MDLENNTEYNHVNILIERLPVLEPVKSQLFDAYETIKKAYSEKHKLLVAGNGGSAADSEHIAGELMKSFRIPRHISPDFSDNLCRIDTEMGVFLTNRLECPLTVAPLVGYEAFSTAYINDVDADSLFAQQLLGHGQAGDVFLGISTSGNSKNILYASVVARALNMKVVGLTGANGGDLKRFADVIVNVPEEETYLIQELHLPIYHCWCLMLEEYFFGNGNNLLLSEKQ